MGDVGTFANVCSGKDPDEGDESHLKWNARGWSWTCRALPAVALAVGLLAVVWQFGGNAINAQSISVGTGQRQYDLSKAEDRYLLLQQIKAAAGPGSGIPAEDTGMALWKIDPLDYRKYVSGQHRRPTDPATPEEIQAALRLLFGNDNAVNSLLEADALSANPKGWAAVNAQLAPNFHLYPEMFHQVNRIPGASVDCTAADETATSGWGPYTQLGGGVYAQRQCSTRERAEQAFLEHAQQDVLAAHQWLRENDKMRAWLTWGSISSTTTHVPDRNLVAKVDAEIDAGEMPDKGTFRKLVAVKVSGSVTDVKPNGDIFRAEVYIPVDVTNVSDAFVDKRYVDAYSGYGGNQHDPGRAKINDRDLQYLLFAAHSLYGLDQFGKQRNYIPFCNCDPNNFMDPDCSIIGGWNSLRIRYFVKPFEWLDKDTASTYGSTRDEHLLSVQLSELAPSNLPVDGQQVTAGTFLFPSPLTVLQTVNRNASVAPRTDPHNTLLGSEAIALAWYGRGLTFDVAEVKVLVDAMQANDYKVGALLLGQAIHRAWADDQVHGVFPGRLAKRDGVLVPELVVNHPLQEPAYANHATATVVQQVLADELAGIRPGQPPHRDIRDNPAYLRPPIDPETGLPLLAPNGKHIEAVAVDGPSFKMDGYSVEWNVGLTWRFDIGFEVDSGLTLYNVRIVLPPTAAFPNGELVPYAHRIAISNFGTAYATSSLGAIFSATFLESHFSSAVGLVPGQNCRGPHATLPVFRALGMSDVTPFLERPIFYSTYGVDGVVDPYAAKLGYKNVPFQMFAIDGKYVNQGIIANMICISEADAGHAMWHLYTAQRLRMLSVSAATVSDSYNVVVNYEFFSNGKMKIAERLHGKPAVVNFGLPGVGGAYASKGKGGFTSNHVHWHGIAIEPAVRANLPGVVNKVFASDLAWRDDDTNWFGMAFHRRATKVEWSNQTDLLRFNYSTNRFWRLAALSPDGSDMGGLAVRSAAWGPAPLLDYTKAPPKYTEEGMPFFVNETFANHWWLNKQDVYVQNADHTRARQVLLSPGRDSSCRVGSAHRCLPDEPIGDWPSVHIVMKLYHGVIQDELPVQNGFTNVETEIAPHNLFGFNPNLLVRYMPHYSDVFQNNPFWNGSKPIYTPPYSSEWAEL